MPPFLSKSRYINGLQCLKYLWYLSNARDQIPAVDSAQQAIFDQGNEVGLFAQQRYPGGIVIEVDGASLDEQCNRTTEALTHRLPIFEAAFQHNGLFARVDILRPAEGNAWDIIEVKSSTDQKEVHVFDIAFQRYVLDAAGVQVNKCILLVINNQYERRGEVDAAQLFREIDFTSSILPHTSLIPSEVVQMRAAAALPTAPNISIGAHCDDPYECPLKTLCWPKMPEHSIFTLYRFRDKIGAYLQGIQDITSLPSSINLNDKQQIQVQAAQTGNPHIDRSAIKAFLATLKYPLFYLDFETYATAIPLHDGTRPYQKVPFQYSLDVVSSPDTTPVHYEFLHERSDDPRPALHAALKSQLGSSGTIVAYNAGFEKGVLQDLAIRFEPNATWINSITARFVDLLSPFRSFDYYHPSQHGSASIKVVLPALVGSGYEGLAIGDGTTASNEYLRVTFGGVESAERESVFTQLKEYCGLDTVAMIRVVEELGRI